MYEKINEQTSKNTDNHQNITFKISPEKLFRHLPRQSNPHEPHRNHNLTLSVMIYLRNNATIDAALPKIPNIAIKTFHPFELKSKFG